MKESTKDWLVVFAGAVALTSLVLYIAFLVVPSWWTAHQECSGTNGLIVEQKDILRPVVCLRVPR